MNVHAAINNGLRLHHRDTFNNGRKRRDFPPKVRRGKHGSVGERASAWATWHETERCRAEKGRLARAGPVGQRIRGNNGLAPVSALLISTPIARGDAKSAP